MISPSIMKLHRRITAQVRRGNKVVHRACGNGQGKRGPSRLYGGCQEFQEFRMCWLASLRLCRSHFFSAVKGTCTGCALEPRSI